MDKSEAFAEWYAGHIDDGRTAEDIENEATERFDEWFEIDGRMYRVLDEGERGDEHGGAFREACDAYADDCLLPDAHETVACYFDYEAFARDCRLGDGYGHILGGYDGSEEEHAPSDDGEWIFIYRQN